MTQNKNIEMMKKLVEAKKQKSATQGSNGRPEKTIGTAKTKIKLFKRGGMFDQ